jgi:cellulose synthase/poly-beta-1,6-N-acetylglucosamine synthase-like glycosyltransferase
MIEDVAEFVVVALQVFVLGYFVFVNAFLILLLAMAAVDLRRQRLDVWQEGRWRLLGSDVAPVISILAPAHNEAATVTESVRSLLTLRYPSLEVVLVNDGSSDDTLARLVEAFDLRKVQRPTPPFLSHRPVRGIYLPRGGLRLVVVDKENGGKADSLNAGINFSSYPLVCAIDADSMLEQDALVKAAMPFVDDPRGTVATGGMLRIANGCRVESGRILRARLPRAPLPMFQVLEYMRAFTGARTAWSALNGLLIVSGAFGLFRKDAVLAAGGYRTDIVGEDIELIVRLHRAMRDQRRAYRVVYVPDAVCWTEAPESARVLRRQRRRWHRGSLETLFIHRRMLFNPRYRAAGLLGLPALLLFEILGPVIELSGYGVAIAAAVTGTLSVPAFLVFLAVAILYGLILTLGSLALEDIAFGRYPRWRDLLRMLAFALAESAGYRQLLHLWRLEGFWQLARKGDWGTMERKGLARPELDSTVEAEVGLR